MIDRALRAPAIEIVPRHLAIIMDGNRRWARERGLPPTEGHRRGVRALRATCRACADAGVEVLTVYAFSEENWQRERAEVSTLMQLMQRHAICELTSLRSEGVQVRVIGRTDRLPAATRCALDDLTAKTERNNRLILNLAINYSARTELCDAVRSLANDVAAGKLPAAAIDEGTLSQYLYTAGLPDPDLLIRTGGELRVSNFLLYQIAYTELWSTTTYWPEFDRADLDEAFEAYSKRKRRFGK
ncbi:MAG: polyprenyl diphosphate synthase [Vulcanimicrobiaceae bacterium]